MKLCIVSDDHIITIGYYQKKVNKATNTLF